MVIKVASHPEGSFSAGRPTPVGDQWMPRRLYVDILLGKLRAYNSVGYRIERSHVVNFRTFNVSYRNPNIYRNIELFIPVDRINRVLSSPPWPPGNRCVYLCCRYIPLNWGYTPPTRLEKTCVISRRDQSIPRSSQS